MCQPYIESATALSDINNNKNLLTKILVSKQPIWGSIMSITEENLKFGLCGTVKDMATFWTLMLQISKNLPYLL